MGRRLECIPVCPHLYLFPQKNASKYVFREIRRTSLEIDNKSLETAVNMAVQNNLLTFFRGDKKNMTFVIWHPIANT